MVFIDDEAIRALVAQEMLWSGNWVAPTMHGDAYLNKPPGWNWLLAISLALHGEASEWAVRLPTVICLLGFAATTWAFSRRYFRNHLAIIHALTVITCGRMLFWDSMLGLIDVCFSWVVYTQIMVLYRYGRRGDWWRAFLFSYGLTAIGWMLKGPPAIVFQGLSVFAILGWTRAWWQLIRPAHLVSGLLCVGALGGYYLLYADYVDLQLVVERLLVESGKRTAVAYGWGDTLGHVAAFPFEMAYHFLPWTILLPFLFLPGSWRRLKKNDFAAFCLVAFLVNVPIYWLSPNVYPRYLLMLFPLLFASLLWLYVAAGNDPNGQGVHLASTRVQSFTRKAVRRLLAVAMVVAAVGIPFIPLVPRTEIVTYPWIKIFCTCVPALLLAWLAVRTVRRERPAKGRYDRDNFLLIFACFLLVLRLVFNFFVLPPRAAGDERGLAVRNSAYAVVERSAADSLYIYGYTLIEPATGFYLTRARGRIVQRHFDGFDNTSRYIVSGLQYPELEVVAADSLYLRHLRLSYPVGRLSDPPTGRAEPREVLRDGMGSGVRVDR